MRTKKIKMSLKENSPDPFANVPQDLWHLVPGFLDRRQDDIKILQDSLEKENFDAVLFVGHRLKGIGTSYGFEGISELGITLETQAKQHDFIGLAGTVQNLIHMVDNLKDCLSRV